MLRRVEVDGKLYIVATPIGNLKDITLRAIEILRMVDRIVAEDTRHSRKLLSHFNIRKKIISLHSHNESQRSDYLINCLKNGENLAFIVDAGTPLISDPGHLLVKKVREAKLSIIPIPGPSALITALSVSGLNKTRFCFEGFLPKKGRAKQKRLEALQHEERAMIFYEPPHDLLYTLNEMQKIFGEERQMTVAKELTKTHETLIEGSIFDVINWLKEDEEHEKGEFVLILSGSENKDKIEISKLNTNLIFRVLLNELPIKQASRLTQQITGVNKNELYQMGLKFTKEEKQ